MKQKIVFIVLLMFSFANLNAQELVGSSGDNFSNSSYSMDWSVGEVATSTYSNATYILNEGFHQNHLAVTQINDVAVLELKVYPNPTANCLKIVSESTDFDLKISDLSGKILLTKKICSTQTSIDFSDYDAGIYLLTIKQNNKVETFKIIKK